MIKRTLYFGNPAYLSLTNKQLVIHLPEVEKADNVSEIIKEKSVRTIPIEDIGVVMLDHKQITVTQALIEALMLNNVAVITTDSSQKPTPICPLKICCRQTAMWVYSASPTNNSAIWKSFHAKNNAPPNANRSN